MIRWTSRPAILPASFGLALIVVEIGGTVITALSTVSPR